MRGFLRPAQLSDRVPGGGGLAISLFVVLALALLISAPAMADIHSREVEAYSQNFDLPTQKADAQLAIQERGAEFGIVEELKQRLGANYAGVWFDNESGEFVVPLLPGASRGVVDSELAGADLEDDFRSAPASSSWEELETARERVDKALAGLLASQLVQTSLDPRANAVVIRVAEDADKAERVEVDRIASRESVSVEVQSNGVARFDTQTLACNVSSRLCDKPLRAGVYIDWAGTHEKECTAGFKVLGNVYENRFVLTAGHCYKGSADWATRESENVSHYLGHIEEGVYPGGDWAKIKVNGSGYGEYWDTVPWTSPTAYWGGSQNISMEYESSSYIGQSVCYSGAITGSGCGTVKAIDVTANHGAGNIYHLTEAINLFAGPGDSGGPVWAGNTALGLIEGGNPGNNPTYFVEVTEANSAMGVHIGTPVGAPPSAETKAATSVEGRQATFNGKVDPNGLSTSYHFEYGTTTSFGTSTQSWSAGSGWGASEVGQVILNLKPSTTYYYRLVATNSQGTSYGGMYGLTTTTAPPLAKTEGSSGVAQPGVATLLGTVNPGGLSTDYRLEWGTTTGYGKSIPIPDEGVGSGTGDVSVDEGIEGLKGQTTYHYRLAAENSKGTAAGEDKTFTTPDWRPKVTTEKYENFVVEEEKGKVTLRGKVNPNGFSTAYHFEWGSQAEFEKGEYNNVIPAEDVNIGSGKSDYPVYQQLGIKGSSYYHFRLVAQNAEGKTNGVDKAFWSPYWAPDVVIGEPSNVGLEKATLNATINPMGFASSYHFEWDDDFEFKSSTSIPIPDANLGSGQKGVKVSQAVEGLEPDTTYHVRVVAKNKEGTNTYGYDNFTTYSNAGFLAEQYPAQVESDAPMISMESIGRFFECEAPIVDTEMENPSLTLAAQEFEGQMCVDTPFIEAPWKMNGCEFSFYPGEVSEDEAEGFLEVGPSECGPISVEYYPWPYKCTFKIGSQANIPATFKNVGEWSGATVEVSLEGSWINILFDGNNGLCLKGQKGSAMAYSTWELSAKNEWNEPIGLQVENME